MQPNATANKLIGMHNRIAIKTNTTCIKYYEEEMNKEQVKEITIFIYFFSSIMLDYLMQCAAMQRKTNKEKTL